MHSLGLNLAGLDLIKSTTGYELILHPHHTGSQELINSFFLHAWLQHIASLFLYNSNACPTKHARIHLRFHLGASPIYASEYSTNIILQNHNHASWICRPQYSSNCWHTLVNSISNKITKFWCQQLVHNMNRQQWSFQLSQPVCISILQWYELSSPVPTAAMVTYSQGRAGVWVFKIFKGWSFFGYLKYIFIAHNTINTIKYQNHSIYHNIT